MQITTIGIDLAKTVFQIHAVDADGATVIRKRLRRAEVLSFVSGLEPCLIGMEACATSHYWARELAKFGHTVKLMPPAYVKPYVKRGKNDATDAEAICEAVTRPNMRFVPVKSADQQAVLMLHRARALAYPAADDAGERVPGTSCGVRDRGCTRHQARARIDRESLRRRRACH
jgi:transposase